MKMQFSQQELAQMSPRVRAWAINNGYASDTQSLRDFGVASPSEVNTVSTPRVESYVGPNMYQQLTGVSADGNMRDPRVYDQHMLSPEGKAYMDELALRQSGGSMSDYRDYGVMSPSEVNSINNLGLGGNPGVNAPQVTPVQTQSLMGDPSINNPNYNAMEAEGLGDVSGGEEGLTSGQAQGLAMGGNMVANMINTRDKELVNTPVGNKGSMSGILKGGVQGASTGASMGGMVGGPKGAGIGAVIGGTLGILGGAQGYFDSRTPPTTTTQVNAPIRGNFGWNASNINLLG